MLSDLREAFDGSDVSRKNIAIRKAHDEIARLQAALADTADLHLELAETKAALAATREILAGSDAGSLPGDMTIEQMAQARMSDHAHAWGRVERGDARAASLEAALADAERERDEAQSACTAWQEVFEGIEAHLLDRINCGDPANPQNYLEIIRADVARVLPGSKQIVAARWADNARERQARERAEKERDRLREILDAISVRYHPTYRPAPSPSAPRSSHEREADGPASAGHF